MRPKLQKKKKHENTTVSNKQKPTICVFECWLDCQLTPFEALRSLFFLKKKNIDDPTPSWSTVPPLRFPSFFFVLHRNMSGERMFVVTERCILGGPKKKMCRDAHPYLTFRRHSQDPLLLTGSILETSIPSSARRKHLAPPFFPSFCDRPLQTLLSLPPLFFLNFRPLRHVPTPFAFP